MIYRIAEERLRDLLRYFPALVLTGARQTGKTTLLRKVFPSYGYISLDLPSQAALAEEAPDRFFERNPPPCIIDEVQNAPGVFRHLKVRIDGERHAMGSWILTGSQKFTLMKNISDSLAGRTAILELEGLSWSELAGAGIMAKLEAFLLRGGFPELWRVPELPAGSFFSAYLSSYLERDVRQILNVGSLRDFERFIRVLAAR
ncbi:MAG: AAA family ATPase, partial [Spirochaetaceae bacterium]|nr:AAA family ATPase [Spirochaetaceae bacterium]